MMVSSGDSSGANRATVSATNAAGTITQMLRGGASAATSSSSDRAPCTPSLSIAATASALTS